MVALMSTLVRLEPVEVVKAQSEVGQYNLEDCLPVVLVVLVKYGLREAQPTMLAAVEVEETQLAQGVLEETVAVAQVAQVNMPQE